MRLAYSITVSITILITIINVLHVRKFNSQAASWVRKMLICSIVCEAANLSIALHPITHVKDTFMAHSIYYSSIDWILFFLFGFVLVYTSEINKISKCKLWAIGIISFFDSCSLILNFFTEHAFSYYIAKHTDGNEYMFITGHLPFQLHLMFSYVMVFFIFARLGRKIFISVSYYRLQFIVQFFTIFTIVLFNGLILLFDLPLDWSILLYSFAGILVNFFSEIYIPRTLINKSLRSTTDDFSEGLILFDIYDKCTYVNHAASDMFGITVETCDINSEPFTQWTKGFKVRDIHPFEETFSALDANGETIQYKLMLRHITNAKGQYLGCYFVSDDVTQEYKYTLALEKSTLEAEKAKEEAYHASTAKGAFLANMSHEIRTPINAILGMNEMILREDASQEIKDYAKNIQAAGDALLSIINDILDFSKIESGKMELQPVVYDPFKLIKNCETIIQPRMQGKHLSLIVKCDENCPKSLRGDEVRVRQIVTNLLTNAAKYTEEGSVTISLNWETIDASNGNLTISVTDTGIGISEENQSKLFNAFQRVDETRNRNIEGTGLGLSITSQLVKLMNGSIGVKSTLGQGSTFSAIIPQVIVDATPHGAYSEAKTETGSTYHELFKAPNAHVLAVDDYKMNLTVLKGLLKKTEIKLSFASSGEEALKEASYNHFDLILMDHMMPGMDGPETLKKLREMDTPNDNTPVIMLTANAISGAEEEYLAAGFTAYLTKPIDSKQLEKALLKYLPEELIER